MKLKAKLSIAYRCHKKRKKKNGHGLSLPQQTNKQKNVWPIIANLDQNACWCIYRGQRPTWLSKVKMEQI